MRRRRIKSRANIDMTSLMDLTFMLLIVFIVTVPIMDNSIDITVPTSNRSKDKSQYDPKQGWDDPGTIRVALDNTGQYSIDGMPIDPSRLEEEMWQLKAQGRTSVSVRADGQKTSLDEFMAVFRAARRNGLDVRMITKQE